MWSWGRLQGSGCQDPGGSVRLRQPLFGAWRKVVRLHTDECGAGGMVEGKWAAELYQPDSPIFFTAVGGQTIC